MRDFSDDPATGLLAGWFLICLAVLLFCGLWKLLEVAWGLLGLSNTKL